MCWYCSWFTGAISQSWDRTGTDFGMTAKWDRWFEYSCQAQSVKENSLALCFIGFYPSWMYSCSHIIEMWLNILTVFCSCVQYLLQISFNCSCFFLKKLIGCRIASCNKSSDQMHALDFLIYVYSTVYDRDWRGRCLVH